MAFSSINCVPEKAGTPCMPSPHISMIPSGAVVFQHCRLACGTKARLPGNTNVWFSKSGLHNKVHPAWPLADLEKKAKTKKYH